MVVEPPAVIKDSIRRALSPHPSSAEEDAIWPTHVPLRHGPGLERWFSERRTLAAVLIPLIERAGSIDVLFTQRADNLRDHAGQVSFPGGRIEPSDASPWDAAVREAQEEIGLAPDCVEFAGYLPDHYVGTSFRVTPTVGFVRSPLTLSLAPAEVTEVFEVPLAHIFDLTNRTLRARKFGEITVQFHDIKFQHRSIWGATAGMLVTLQRLLEEQSNSLP